jgi:mannose-P-dolichol utilization defect protein 1
MDQIIGLLQRAGLVSPQCAKTFFIDHNFLDVTCLTYVLSKALGWLVLLGAVFVKVPQVLAILNKKSVAGLSLTMFLLELLGYCINFSYGYVQKFPFSTYGESGIILIQNLVIIYLFSVYGNIGKMGSLGAVLASIGFTYSAVNGLVPHSILGTLQTGSIAIFSASKIPQIISNFRNKSTGALSLITFLLNFGGSMARVFTTMKELDDNVVLMGYVIGAALNGIILLQILFYGDKSTSKAVSNINKKKKKM